MCKSAEQSTHGKSLLQSLVAPRVKRKVVSEGEPGGKIQKIKQHTETGLLHLRTGEKEQQMPAGWFGGFSEHESTWTQDAMEASSAWPEREVWFPKKDGADHWQGEQIGEGQRKDEYFAGQKDIFPSRWFEESPSGGPNAAWQTFYPSLDELGHFGSRLTNWRYNSNGHWEQMYEPPSAVHSATTSMAKSAGWFDTGVTNYDAFGRINEPASRSRMYLNWEPKLSHAKLTCDKPGCVANTSLQVYAPGTEAKCFMTFATHPTDFDNDESDEVYDWIEVNYAKVNTWCRPRATGCGPKAVNKTWLYPCMLRQDISQNLKENNGTLRLAAKINDMVDECPLTDGSLLSGAAEIYCLVRPEETTPSPATAQKEQKRGVDTSAVLQCQEPGCVANATVEFDNLFLSMDLKCEMNIKIRQTDFDQDLGSVELVEWLNIGGKQVKTNCTPGENPCKNATKKADVVHEFHNCVSGEAFTPVPQSGRVSVNVSAKISPKVDECASEGYLLDGLVEVTCRPNKQNTTTAAPAAAAATTAAAEATTPAAAK